MGLIELCQTHFNTSNLYEVLQISEQATEKEVKKAYHKLSLKVHPDRVNENEKLDATEKFKVLGSVHTILSDKEKRALYDTTKCVDDEDYNIIEDKDWTIYWRLLFKKITDDDIKAYEKEYIGSQDERNDLKNAYLSGKGDMDIIVDRVQFARSEQEDRLRGILKEMIDQGEIPAYRKFTHESAKKRQRRLAKENREAKEAEELQKSLDLKSESSSLEVMIKQKQSDRAKQLDSFIDNLAEKYGGKTKGTKRKASSKTETATKNKKRK